jgi:hypothetical protein
VAELSAICPCGDVAITLAGGALAQVWCHCDDCQRAHGAAYVPRAIYPKAAVTVASGETRTWVNRVRTMVVCARCGSHLYSEQEGAPFRGVNAGNLPAGAFKPQMHLHCDYAVAAISDGLPHYRNIPVEYGGSGEVVGW